MCLNKISFFLSIGSPVHLYRINRFFSIWSTGLPLYGQPVHLYRINRFFLSGQPFFSIWSTVFFYLVNRFFLSGQPVCLYMVNLYTSIGSIYLPLSGQPASPLYSIMIYLFMESMLFVCLLFTVVHIITVNVTWSEQTTTLVVVCVCVCVGGCVCGCVCGWVCVCVDVIVENFLKTPRKIQWNVSRQRNNKQIDQPHKWC